MLGNLAILSKSVNPRASNYDFHRKREVLFGGRYRSTFPITSDLNNYAEWTEETIQKRQAILEDVARSILKF